MRIMIRNTSIDGTPLDQDGEVFTGATFLEVVRSMKGAALFSDHQTIEDYIDMVMRNAKMLAGIELEVKGMTPEEKGESLIGELIEHDLARILDEDETKKEGEA